MWAPNPLRDPCNSVFASIGAILSACKGSNYAQGLRKG